MIEAVPVLKVPVVAVVIVTVRGDPRRPRPRVQLLLLFLTRKTFGSISIVAPRLR